LQILCRSLTAVDPEHPVGAQFVWNVESRAQTGNDEKGQHQGCINESGPGNRKNEMRVASQHEQRRKCQSQADAAVHGDKQPMLRAAAKNLSNEIVGSSLQGVSQQNRAENSGADPLIPQLTKAIGLDAFENLLRIATVADQ